MSARYRLEHKLRVIAKKNRNNADEDINGRVTIEIALNKIRHAVGVLRKLDLITAFELGQLWRSIG